MIEIVLLELVVRGCLIFNLTLKASKKIAADSILFFLLLSFEESKAGFFM